MRQKKSLEAYGILNHVGTLWTNETFNSPEDAWQYINASKHATPQHRPVRVRITPLVKSKK